MPYQLGEINKVSSAAYAPATANSITSWRTQQITELHRFVFCFCFVCIGLAIELNVGEGWVCMYYCYELLLKHIRTTPNARAEFIIRAYYDYRNYDCKNK